MSRSLQSSVGVLVVVLVWAGGLAVTNATSAPAMQLLVTGATRVEFDDTAGVWDLTGNPVTVRRGFTVLRAPTIRYHVQNQVVAASGGVSYSDDILSASAGIMTVWIPEEDAVAEEDVEVVYRGTEPVQLHAHQVELLQRLRRLTASGGVTLTQGSSTITADLVEYDETAGQVVASGAARVQTSEGVLAADRIQALLRVDEVIADGHVAITRGDLEGHAAHAVLQEQASHAELSGGAAVRLGRNSVEAATITVDLRTRRVTATGGAHLVAPPTASP